MPNNRNIIYNKLIDNHIMDKSLSQDQFDSWLDSDSNNKNIIYDKLVSNKILDSTGFSSKDFSNWLGTSVPQLATLGTGDINKAKEYNQDIHNSVTEDTYNKGTIYDTPSLGSSSIVSGTHLGGSSIKNTPSDIDLKTQKKVKDDLVNGTEFGNIEDFNPTQLDEILYNNKSQKIIDNVKTASDHDLKLYDVKDKLKEFFKTGNELNPVTYLKNRAKEEEIAKTDRGFIVEKTIADQERRRLNEYEVPLLKALDISRKSLFGDDVNTARLFENIDQKIVAGMEISDKEHEFYNTQLDNLKNYAPSERYLKQLQRLREIQSIKDSYSDEHKKLDSWERLKEEITTKALDKEYQSRDGILGTVFNTLNSGTKAVLNLPGVIASDLYKTGLLVTGNTTALNLTGSDPDGYYQKTSYEQRPSNEDVIDVEYNNSKYTVAFDDAKRVTNIYNKKGYQADLSQQEYHDIINELNKQNPTHETKRITNYGSLASQGLDSMIESIGLIGLTALTDGAFAALAEGANLARLGTVAKGLKYIANSPRLSMALPMYMEYAGKFAEQGIKEGGIIDPDQLLAYSTLMTTAEYATELVNPLEGRIAKGLASPFNKFNSGLLDVLAKERPSISTFLKHGGKTIFNNILGEDIEELIGNPLQEAINRGFNHLYNSGFEKDNPFSLEQIWNTIYSTSISTLPLAVFEGVGTKKSHIIREALDSYFKDEEAGNEILSKSKKTPEEIKKLTDMFASVKSNSTDFIKGGKYENVDDEIRKTILHNNFEITKLEEKPDENKDQIRDLKDDNAELTLHAKYNVSPETKLNNSKDKADILSKIDEALTNDPSIKKAIRGSLRTEIYENTVNSILNTIPTDEEILKQKIKEKLIDDQKLNLVNQIKNKISDLSDKHDIESIRSIALKAQDYTNIDLLKKDEITSLVHKTIDQEIKFRIDKNDEELKQQAQERFSIKNNLFQHGLRDGTKLYENGKEYTFKGYDHHTDDLTLLDESDHPYFNNGIKLTGKELLAKLHNKEISTYNPDTTTTPTTTTTTTTTPTSVVDDKSKFNEKINNINFSVVNTKGNPVHSSNIKDQNYYVNNKQVNRERYVDLYNKAKQNKVNHESKEILDLNEFDYYNEHASSSSANSIAFLGQNRDENVYDNGVVIPFSTDDKITLEAIHYLTEDYSPGTTLDTKIEDIDNVKVYDPQNKVSNSSTEITWKELKERFNKSKDIVNGEKVIYTPSGFALTLNDLIPIRILKENKETPGYIHTTAWIEKYGNPDIKSVQIDTVRNLRKNILKGNNKLQVISYSLGKLNTGEIQEIPSDIKHHLNNDNKLVVDTREGQVEIERKTLSDSDAISIVEFIKAAFGENKNVAEQISKIKKDISDKDTLQNFIQNITSVEKPGIQGINFSDVVKDKANINYGKTDTISIEINKDDTDLGYSVLLGLTNSISTNYTIYRLSKVNGKLEAFKLVNYNKQSSWKSVSTDLYFKELTLKLTNKKYNYRNRASEIYTLENGKLTSTSFNEFITPKLVSNIHFNKIGESYTSYFQPNIQIDLVKSEVREVKDDTSDDNTVNYLPLSSDTIGNAVEDYVITGISEELATTLATAISGATFSRVYQHLKTNDLESFKDVFEKEFAKVSQEHKDEVQILLNNSKSVGLEVYKTILDQWNKLENISKFQFKANTGIEIENVDEEDIFNDYSDDTALTTDIFDKGSDEVKALFSFIENKEGKNNQTRLFNVDKKDLFKFYHDKATIWTQLSSELAIDKGNYLEPRWDKRRIRRNHEKEDIITIKERILQSNLSFKNEFIEAVEKNLSKAQISQLSSLLFNSFKKMTIARIDNNKLKKVNQSTKLNWDKKKKEFVDNLSSEDRGLIRTVVTDDENTFHYEKTDKFKDILKELYDLTIETARNHGNNKDKYDRLKNIFDRLGIVLTDKTWKEISQGRFKNRDGDSFPIFSETGFNLAKLVYNNLNGSFETPVNLFNDSIFESLALFDLKTSNSKISNTEFIGGKSIQNVGLVRNFEQRFNQFANGIIDVKNTAYGKLSDLNRTFKIWSIENVAPIVLGYNKKEAGYDKLTEKDQLVFAIQRYDNVASAAYEKHGNQIPRGEYVTSPMEGKKNPFIVTAPRYNVENEEYRINLLIHQVVLPEILRIKYAPKNGVIGYNPFGFYHFKSLNNSVFADKNLYNDNEDGTNNVINFKAIEEYKELDNPNIVKEWFNEVYYNELKSLVSKELNQIISKEKEIWDKHGIIKLLPDTLKSIEKDGEYISSYKEGSLMYYEDREKGGAIRDYVVNHMIYYVNETMITGDPAYFNKDDNYKEFDVKSIEKSLVNRQKRMSMWNASTQRVSDGEDMKVIVSSDVKLSSNIIKELNDKGIEGYDGKTTSDAQMLTNPLSYLEFMHKFNKITDSEYEYLKNRVKAQTKDLKKLGYIEGKNRIDYSKIKSPLYALKTVIVSTERRDNQDVPIYIKMSEFPLFPEITAGLEIDKIRQLMDENKADKFTFSSAFKVSSPTPLSIKLTQNNRIDSFEYSDINDHISIVNQDMYGEQTENPQSDSYKIVIGTQKEKLKFVNLLNEKFKHPFKEGTISGEDLKRLRDEKLKKIIDLRIDKLLKQLKPNGKLDYKALINLLKDEIRDWDATFIYALSEKVIKDIPLWLNPLFKRILPKLLAIVDSRISKVKVNGKGYVQAFSDFFKGDFQKSSILTIKGWDGELKAIHEIDEKGNKKIIGSQILVPWWFKAKMSNYVVKEYGMKYLDTTKIDSKLLEATGFRIPTSGLNSISRLEVVGFLPKSMGNTILIPSDVMAQMGSDLDFDKMQSLFYNAEETSEGLKDIREEFKPSSILGISLDLSSIDIENDREDKEELKLQNDLLDIDRALLLSDSPVVIKQNKQLIGYGDLEKLANEREAHESTSFLSVTDKRNAYLGSRIGKSAVGSFSIDNTFHALLQGTKINYIVTDSSLFKYFDGDVVLDSDGKDIKYVSLDRIKTRNGKKNVSEVYSAYQNAALDNDTKRFLTILGINTNNLNLIRGMTQLGYDETEIQEILDNPIIKELNEKLNTFSGITTQFKAADEIFKEMLKEYPKSDILMKYKAYDQLGKDLGKIRNIFNLDSNGFKGNGWNPVIKQDRIDKFNKNQSFTNLSILVVKANKYTYSGATSVPALNLVKNLFYNSSLIPFNEENIIEKINEVISFIPDYLITSIDSQGEKMNDIFEEYKKYMYSAFTKLFNVDNIEDERRKLLISDSLANKLQRIKTTEDLPIKVKRNLFLNTIEYDLTSSKSKIKYVKLDNSKEKSNLDLQRAVVDLYNNKYPLWDNYNTKDLVIDFYKYAYLVSQQQGSTDFMNILPLDFIYNHDQLKSVINTISNINSEFNLNKDLNPFTIQYFQHNPEDLPFVDSQTFSESENGIIESTDDLPSMFRYSKVVFDYSKPFIAVKLENEQWISLPKVGSYFHSIYDINNNNPLKDLRSSVDTVKTPTGNISITEFDVKEVIDNLVEKGSDETKYLTKLLDYIPDVKGFFVKNAEYNGRQNGNNIYINSDLIDSKLSKVLTHELTHAVLSSLINRYQTNRYLLTKDQITYLSKIEEIYNNIKNDGSAKLKEQIAKFEQARKDKKLPKLDADEKLAYSLSSLDEFLSFFTDESSDLREYIKNNYDKKEQNWFSKLRELLKKLLNTIIGNENLTEVLDKLLFKVIEISNETIIDDYQRQGIEPAFVIGDEEDEKDNEKPINQNIKTIRYTPKGKTQQTYTVKDSQIFNKEGEEVFKGDSKDRNKIFANLAVQEKQAVVVSYKDKQYVVDKNNQIVSVQTGDIMKWGDENGDRKSILQLAKDKFGKAYSEQSKSISNLQKQNIFTVNPIKSADKKAIVKASVANKFIGFGEDITDSSTAEYARQINEQSNNLSNLSKTLSNFLQKFIGENDESNIEESAKKLTNEDKIWLGKAIGKTYKNLNLFDWYQDLFSNIGQENVFYFLYKNTNLEKDIRDVLLNSKLYKDYQNFIKENKKYVEEYHKLPFEIKKEQQKDFDKLKIKNEWFQQQIDSFEYDKRKELLNDINYSEDKKISNSNIVNSGNYNSNDVVFVSIGGKRDSEPIRKEQQDKIIKEALKAIEAGATLITDNKSYIENSDYNEGEKRLAKNLEAKGYNYLEETVDGEVLGVWNKKIINNNQDNLDKFNQSLNNNYYPKVISVDDNIKDIQNKLFTFLNNYGFEIQHADNLLVNLNSKNIQLDTSNIDHISKALSEPLSEMLSYSDYFYEINKLINKSDLYKKLIAENELIYGYNKNNIRLATKEIFKQLLESGFKKELIKQLNIDKSLLDKIKNFISNLINILKDININKVDNIINEIVENTFKGNDFIRLTKKEGYEKINFQEAFDKNILAKDVMSKIGSNSDIVLTGSIAYSTQGSVFRKIKTMVHDLDFISLSNIEENSKLIKSNFPNSVKVYSFKTTKYSTDTFLVPPNNTVISDIIRRKDGNKIISYNIKNNNNEIIGTYKLEYEISEAGRIINENEIKNGVEALLVDFFNDTTVDNKNYIMYDFRNINNDTIKVKLVKYEIPFKAKLDFSRFKDIWDYNRFIPNNLNKWETNKDKILELYPDYTESEFNLLTEKEKQKLLDCI